MFSMSCISFRTNTGSFAAAVQLISIVFFTAYFILVDFFYAPAQFIYQYDELIYERKKIGGKKKYFLSHFVTERLIKCAHGGVLGHSSCVKGVSSPRPMFVRTHVRRPRLRRSTCSDAGAAMRWGRAWGRADQLAVKTVDALPPSRRHLADAQHIGAERLHGVQPLDLYQAGQEVGDAVARRAHSLEELQAVAHAPDLITLQPEALGQVPPRLHHGRLAAVGGAEHAAGLLQAVEGKFCWAQAWREMRDSTWLTTTGV